MAAISGICVVGRFGKIKIPFYAVFIFYHSRKHFQNKSRALVSGGVADKGPSGQNMYRVLWKSGLQ
jgi:hypothetical protein